MHDHARPVDHDHGDDGDGHDHHPGKAHRLNRGHGHTGLAHHDHEAGDVTVVYAEDDSRMTSPGHVPAPTRGVHDLDSLMRRLDLPPDTGAPDRWLAVAPPLIRSHISPVLDRPPRA